MHEKVVVKQRVEAPVDKVWNALTDKNQMKEWYFDIPDFDLNVHQEFNFYEPGGAQKFRHHGEILEVIPKQKLKHTWSYPEISREKTIVRWELEPDNGGTVVTLTHKGLENLTHLGSDFQKESFENGWTELVTENLKEFVEQ